MMSVIRMRNIIGKYQDKSKYDYSCSETILRSSNDYFNLGLEAHAFKMMAPFSGGMFEGDLCGIVSAAVSVLGILYTEGVAHTSPILVDAVTRYKQSFKALFGTMTCNVLLETKRDPNNGCASLVMEGGALLVEITKEIDLKYNIMR